MDRAIVLIPVWASIQESWQKVKGSKSTFILAMLINIAIICSFQLICPASQKNPPLYCQALSLLADIMTYLTSIGVLYIGIRRAQNLPISFKMMFRGFEFNLAWRLIFSYCLQFLALIPGIALIFAGAVAIEKVAPYGMLIGLTAMLIGACLTVFIFTRLLFSPLFIIENGHGPIEAIKLSYRATRGNVWRLIGLMAFETMLVVLSVLTLMIGMIWAYPLICITHGTVYEKLKAQL